ncbi:hypothetical protein CYMTET_48652 [Cymbomonas tetramitiformis]|uniref:EF-hand domain-containing protein n=1 Tax=Cymbomonas tetramitiformis TaxID=36881 RepID=A0AAE0BRU0_9CHLO|nr:hypothetical protein CYMTET_48652 [Cymbomonas tetramitiformis]
MPSRGKAGETQELCREGFYVEDLQCFVGESAPPKHFETYRSQAVLMFPTVEEQRDSLGAEGSITLEDFQRQLLLEDVCREDAKHWFRIMDGDGNGQLSVQEWVEAISFPAPAGAEDPSVGLVAKTSMSFEELAMRLCLHLWATVVTDLAQSSGRRAAKRMVAWFADLEEQKEALVQILTCDSLSDAHLQCVIPRLRPEDASTITNELSRLAAVSQEQGPRLEQPVKSAKWRVRPSGRAALKGRRQRGVLSVTTAVDCAARTVRERQQLAPFLQEKLPIEAGLPDWWKHLHAKTGNISDCIMVSKTTFSKGETIVVRWHLDEGCTFLGNNCVQTSLRKSLDLPVKAGDLNGTPVVALVPLNFFEDLHFTSGGGGGAYRRNDISYKDITLNPNMRAELEGWPAVKGGVLKLPVPSLKAGSEYMLQLFNTNGTTHGNVIRSAIGDPIQIAVMADSVPQAPLNLAVTETGVDYLVVRLQGPENFRHSGELAQMGVSEVCDYDFMLKAEDFVHSHTSAIGVHSFDTPGCLCNACAWMCTECAIPSQQLQAGDVRVRWGDLACMWWRNRGRAPVWDYASGEDEKCAECGALRPTARPQKLCPLLGTPPTKTLGLAALTSQPQVWCVGMWLSHDSRREASKWLEFRITPLYPGTPYTVEVLSRTRASRSKLCSPAVARTHIDAISWPPRLNLGWPVPGSPPPPIIRQLRMEPADNLGQWKLSVTWEPVEAGKEQAQSYYVGVVLRDLSAKDALASQIVQRFLPPGRGDEGSPVTVCTDGALQAFIHLRPALQLPEDDSALSERTSNECRPERLISLDGGQTVSRDVAAPCTQFNVSVQARNSAGLSFPCYALLTLPLGEDLPAPTNLHAEAPAEDPSRSIKLTWSAAPRRAESSFFARVINEDGDYLTGAVQVDCSLNAVSYHVTVVEAAAADNTARSHADTREFYVHRGTELTVNRLAPLTKYRLEVRVRMRGAGWSRRAIVEAVTEDPNPDTAPLWLNTTARTSDGVTLEWAGPLSTGLAAPLEYRTLLWDPKKYRDSARQKDTRSEKDRLHLRFYTATAGTVLSAEEVSAAFVNVQVEAGVKVVPVEPQPTNSAPAKHACRFEGLSPSTGLIALVQTVTAFGPGAALLAPISTLSALDPPEGLRGGQPVLGGTGCLELRWRTPSVPPPEHLAVTCYEAELSLRGGGLDDDKVPPIVHRIPLFELGGPKAGSGSAPATGAMSTVVMGLQPGRAYSVALRAVATQRRWQGGRWGEADLPSNTTANRPAEVLSVAATARMKTAATPINAKNEKDRKAAGAARRKENWTLQFVSPNVLTWMAPERARLASYFCVQMEDSSNVSYRVHLPVDRRRCHLHLPAGSTGKVQVSAVFPSGSEETPGDLHSEYMDYWVQENAEEQIFRPPPLPPPEGVQLSCEGYSVRLSWKGGKLGGTGCTYRCLVKTQLLEIEGGADVDAAPGSFAVLDDGKKTAPLEGGDYALVIPRLNPGAAHTFTLASVAADGAVGESVTLNVSPWVDSYLLPRMAIRLQSLTADTATLQLELAGQGRFDGSASLVLTCEAVPNWRHQETVLMTRRAVVTVGGLSELGEQGHVVAEAWAVLRDNRGAVLSKGDVPGRCEFTMLASSATLASVRRPDAPEGLNAEITDSGVVRLSWEEADKSPAAKYYNVEIKAASGAVLANLRLLTDAFDLGSRERSGRLPDLVLQPGPCTIAMHGVGDTGSTSLTAHCLVQIPQRKQKSDSPSPWGQPLRKDALGARSRNGQAAGLFGNILSMKRWKKRAEGEQQEEVTGQPSLADRLGANMMGIVLAIFSLGMVALQIAALAQNMDNDYALELVAVNGAPLAVNAAVCYVFFRVNRDTPLPVWREENRAVDMMMALLSILNTEALNFYTFFVPGLRVVKLSDSHKLLDDVKRKMGSGAEEFENIVTQVKGAMGAARAKLELAVTATKSAIYEVKQAEGTIRSKTAKTAAALTVGGYAPQAKQAELDLETAVATALVKKEEAAAAAAKLMQEMAAAVAEVESILDKVIQEARDEIMKFTPPVASLRKKAEQFFDKKAGDVRETLLEEFQTLIEPIERRAGEMMEVLKKLENAMLSAQQQASDTAIAMVGNLEIAKLLAQNVSEAKGALGEKLDQLMLVGKSAESAVDQAKQAQAAADAKRSEVKEALAAAVKPELAKKVELLQASLHTTVDEATKKEVEEAASAEIAVAKGALTATTEAAVAKKVELEDELLVALEAANAMKAGASAALINLTDQIEIAMAEVKSTLDTALKETHAEILNARGLTIGDATATMAKQLFNNMAEEARESMVKCLREHPIKKVAETMTEALKQLGVELDDSAQGPALGGANAMLSAQQQASDTVIAMVGSLELAKLLAQNMSEAKGALGRKLDQLMFVGKSVESAVDQAKQAQAAADAKRSEVKEALAAAVKPELAKKVELLQASLQTTVDEATKKEVEEAASAEIAVAKGALTATTEAAVAKKVELEDELLVALEAANAMKAGASAALINLTDQIEIAMAEVKSTLDTALKETHAEILNARGLTIGDATATMAKQLFNNMTEEARESMVKCLREHPIKKVAETMTEALKQLGVELDDSAQGPALGTRLAHNAEASATTEATSAHNTGHQVHSTMSCATAGPGPVTEAFQSRSPAGSYVITAQSGPTTRAFRQGGGLFRRRPQAVCEAAGRPEMTASSEVSPKRKASFAFREPPVQITPAMSGDAWSAPATTASDGPDTDLLQTLPDPSLHRPSHRHLRPLIPPRSSMSGAANDLDTPQPLLGTSGEKLEAVPQMALAQPLQRYAKMIVHAQRLASDGDVDPTLAGDAAGQVQQWFQSHLSHCPVCEHKKPLELDAVDQRTEWLNLKNALVACLSREVPQIISLNLILYDALGSNRSPEQALEAEPSTTLALVATGMMVGIRAFQLLVFLLKSLYARLMRTRETPPSIVRNALSLSGTHNGKGVIEWDPRRVRDARGRQIRCKHFWVTWEEVGGATSGSSSRAVRVVNGDASQCTMDLVEPLLDYEVTVLGVAQKGLIRAVMKERLCIPPILVVEKTSPQSTTVAFSAAATTGSRSQCTVEVVEIGPPAAGALAVSSRTWRVPVSYDKSRGLFLASANLAPGRAYTLTVCAGTLQSLPVAVRTPALPNPPSRLEISQLASGQQQLHVYPPISMGSEDHLPVDAYRVSMRRADIREGEQELPGVGEAVLRELKALGQQVGDRLVFDAAFDSASAAGITVYEMSNLPPGASLILQVVAVNRKHETESAAAEISLTTPQSVPPERASPEPGEPGSGQPGSREEDLQKSTAEGEEATMPTMPPPRNVRVALGDVPVVLWDPAALLTGHGAAPAIEEYLVKVQWGAANGVDRPADGGTLISLPPARTSITLGELSVPVDHQQDVVVSVASRAEGHADCWSAPLRVPPSLELAKALEAPEVEVAERGTHSVLLKWRARPRRESPPQWGVLVRSVGPDESATAETVGAMLMVTNPSFSPDEWVGMADSDVHPPRGPGTLDISEAPHFTTCTVTGLEADTAYEIAVVPRGLGTSSECAAAFRPVRTLKGMSAAPIPQNGDIDPQQATHFKYPTMLEPSAVDLRGIVGKPGVAEVTWSPPSENAALVKEYLISLLPAWAHAESLEDRADRGADEGAVGSKQGDDAAAAVARMESIHFKEMTYRAVPATGLGKQRLLVENLDPEQVYVVRVQAVGWSSSAAAIAQVCDPHASLKAVDWVSTMRLGSEELATRLITAAAQRFIDLHSKQSEVDAMDVEYPLGIAILPAADLPIQLQKLLHRYTDALYESGISDDGAVQRILAVIDSHKAEVLEEAAELQKKLKSSMEGGEEGALSAAELEGILGQVHKFVVDQWRWWQKPDALAPKSEAEAEKLILEINNTLVTALGSLRNFEDVISMGTPGQLVDAWCSMIGDSRELGLQLKVGLRRALVKAEQVPQAEKDALNSVQVAVAQFDVDPEGAYTTMSDLVPRVVQVLEAQPAWVQSSPEEHAEMLRLLEKEGCIDDVQPDLLQKVVPQRYAFHSSLRLLLASAQQLRIRHEQWLEARREADGRALSAKRGLEVALGAGVPEQLLDAWEGMAAMLKDPLCEDPGLPWKLELRELLIEAGQAPQDEREALEEMEAAAAQFQMRPVEARSALQDIMPRVVRVLEAQPSWVQSSLEEHTEMVRLLEHMGGAEGAAAPEVIKKGPQHAVVFRWLFLQAVKSRHHDHTRLCDKFVSAQEQLRMAKRQAKENNATRETEEQVARALMGMDLKEAQAAVDSLREREPGHPLVKVADDMLRKERGRVVKWAELLTKRGIEAPCGSGWTNVREGGVCGFCNTAVNGDDDGFQCINGCHWLAWVHLEEKGAQHAVLVSSDRDWSFKQHYQVDLQSLVRHLEPEHLSRLVGEQTAIRRAQLRSVTGSARAKERTKRMEEQIAGVRKWQTDLGDMNAVLNHLKAFAESQPLSEAAIEKRDFLIAEERLVRALEDGNPSQIQSAAESVCEQEPAHPLVKAAEEKLEKSKVLAEEQMANTVMSSNPDEVRAALHKLEVFVKSHPLIAAGQERLEGLAAKEQLQHTLEHANSMEIQAALDRFIKHEPFHPLIKTAKGKLHESHTLAKEQMQHAMSCSNLNGMKTALDGLKAFADSQPLVESAKEIAIPLAEKQVTMAMKESASGGRAEMVAALENLQAFAEPAHPLIEAGKQELEVFCAEEKLVYTMEKVMERPKEVRAAAQSLSKLEPSHPLVRAAEETLERGKVMAQEHMVNAITSNKAKEVEQALYYLKEFTESDPFIEKGKKSLEVISAAEHLQRVMNAEEFIEMQAAVDRLSECEPSHSLVREGNERIESERLMLEEELGRGIADKNLNQMRSAMKRLKNVAASSPLIVKATKIAKPIAEQEAARTMNSNNLQEMKDALDNLEAFAGDTAHTLINATKEKLIQERDAVLDWLHERGIWAHCGSLWIHVRTSGCCQFSSEAVHSDEDGFQCEKGGHHLAWSYVIAQGLERQLQQCRT